jgi:hypothetical protein
MRVRAYVAGVADVARAGIMTDQSPGAVPDPPDCPECGLALTHVETVVSSGAFRTQAVNMPQIPIHYYDCDACGTCWKLGTRLLPDPVRQIARDSRS